ncbi:MAG: helix-turn-helix transcriptional regulator [Eubacteriales bacterium]|nr:helix-turn-helix transcriptional regulator [Eubacteriales bacterium]
MSETAFLKEMGQRIMLRRKSLRLTQEELAEKIDVSTQMISNLELGKKAIRPENLAKVCDVLDVSADYVLTGAKRQKEEVNILIEKLMELSENELKIISSMINYMSEKS